MSLLERIIVIAGLIFIISLALRHAWNLYRFHKSMRELFAICCQQLSSPVTPDIGITDGDVSADFVEEQNLNSSWPGVPGKIHIYDARGKMGRESKKRSQLVDK